jgi:hypothetical protein
LSRIRATLPFLQNLVITTNREYHKPKKYPRWSKGVYSCFVLKIRGQKCLGYLDHLICYFKLAMENKYNDSKKFQRKLKSPFKVSRVSQSYKGVGEIKLISELIDSKNLHLSCSRCSEFIGTLKTNGIFRSRQLALFLINNEVIPLCSGCHERSI